MQTLEKEFIDQCTLYSEQSTKTMVGFLPNNYMFIVFSLNASIKFNKKDNPPNKPSDITGFWWIAPPTIKSKTLDQNSYLLPSQGYRDDSGTIVEFIKRKPADWIQHGGIWVDNETGQMSILNYEEHHALFDKALTPSQILIEANWYMDATNQETVYTRANLQQPRAFNAIGTFYRGYTPILFTINSASVGLMDTAKLCNHPYDASKSRLISMREIAASANVITNLCGGQGWQLAGLEYYGGGTYPGSPDVLPKVILSGGFLISDGTPPLQKQFSIVKRS